jgi:electron transport complex protein RnfA
VNIAGILQISIGAILINNFVLVKMLGLCPCLSVSNKVSSATGLGMAVTFVMGMASVIAWIADAAFLVPYDVEYLRIVVYILVITSLTQLVEMALQKFSPMLFESFGRYLPLISANCAVLAAALLATMENPFTGRGFTFAEAFVNGTMSGVGFTLALVLMAGIREKLECSNVWKPLEGLPIALITAGLIALAFLGFSGLHIPTVGGY